MFCPNCGKEIFPDTLFCNHCGKKLLTQESINNKSTSNYKIDKGRLWGGLIFGLILLFFGWMLHDIKGESFVLNLFSKVLIVSCISAFFLSIKEIIDKKRNKSN